MYTDFVKKYFAIEKKLVHKIREEIDNHGAESDQCEWFNCLMNGGNCVMNEGIWKDEFKEYVQKYNDIEIKAKNISFLYLCEMPDSQEKNAIPYDFGTSSTALHEWLGLSQNGLDTSLQNMKFWNGMEPACGSSETFFKEYVVRSYCPFTFRKRGRYHTTLNMHPEIREACRSATTEFLDLLSQNREIRLSVVISGRFGDTKWIENEVSNRENIMGCHRYQP